MKKAVADLIQLTKTTGSCGYSKDHVVKNTKWNPDVTDEYRDWFCQCTALRNAAKDFGVDSETLQEALGAFKRPPTWR